MSSMGQYDKKRKDDSSQLCHDGFPVKRRQAFSNMFVAVRRISCEKIDNLRVRIFL